MVVAVVLPMNAWIKELRAELGRAAGRRRAISQVELAERVGVGLSAVGKWEMSKNAQKPERESFVRLLRLASAELRARAPHSTELAGMPDGNHSVVRDPDHQGDQVTTPEGIMVGRELDEIGDVELRKRARTAALAAIDAERAKSNPTEPGGAQRPDRARRSP